MARIDMELISRVADLLFKMVEFDLSNSGVCGSLSDYSRGVLLETVFGVDSGFQHKIYTALLNEYFSFSKLPCNSWPAYVMLEYALGEDFPLGDLVNIEYKALKDIESLMRWCRRDSRWCRVLKEVESLLMYRIVSSQPEYLMA